MARDLAIDLGTSNTQVFARGRGVILEEPTVIALNTRTHEVLAVGDEAWQLIGRTPGYIVAVRPLREGAITDFGITERTIRLLLRRAGVAKLNRPRVLLCVPSAITSVERRAVKEAARRAGASAAHLIEQPMAAAIGAGLDIHEPVGNMVVDVGGGTTETAVISLGGIVAYRAVRCGGFDMDAAIQEYVRQKHGVAISDRTGEELKIAIGSALPYEGEMRAEVRGREVTTGHPRTVVLTPEEIRHALSEQVELVIDTVLGCLADAPPELAQDIIYEGIHLLGGGARLRGLAERLAQETDVPVHLVPDPLECVVRGAGLCLDSFDSLRPIFAAAES
ncbi:MAG TPA: rod shape-determining protein [Acidimicrobiales bacterium]